MKGRDIMKINQAIKMFLNYCRSIKLSTNTINNYEQQLSKFSDFLTSNSIDAETADVNEITAQTLKLYFIEIQQKYAISTVKQYHAVLSTFYRWLVEDMEVIEFNLLSSVKPRFKHESKKQPVVRDNEMADILDLFDKIPLTRRTYRYWRNKFMMMVMYSCGMRVSEVINLKHSDYYEPEHSFSFVAKGDKEHKIFLTDEEMLNTYYKLRSMRDSKFPDCDWVFTTKIGTKLSRPSIRYIIDTIANDAGIEKHITPHSFRRGCATALLENGADIAVVKDILGHANIATTMRYTQLSDKAIQNTMKLYNPLSNVR